MEDCQEKKILPVTLGGQIMWSAKDASFEKKALFLQLLSTIHSEAA